jgi:F-type H+-transporting ATPase subunit b
LGDLAQSDFSRDLIPKAIPMMFQTIFLAAEAVAKEGGLFDFNATLPIMMIQFVLLATLLNSLFYKPVGKMLDDRDEYIRNNSVGGEERLAEAKRLTQQYEKELAEARRQAQAVIAEAQDAARKIASDDLAVAQQAAQTEREKASQEINNQKQAAFSTLEKDVDALSQQILAKLINV